MNFELQDFLFSNNPSRLDLLNYESREPKSKKIQVFRNHSFELIEHTISAYLDFARIGAVFSYSGYDDSFSFSELDSNVDLIIIWIDTKRYKEINVSNFIEQRLTDLKNRFFNPILVIPYGFDFQTDKVGVTVFNLSEIESELGESFSDLRKASISGTDLSNKAILACSKYIGLRYLPSILNPSLKAVVVDLDNTLYSGVLGEDGIWGITVTEGHKRLQKMLKNLAGQGFFLCIASKNEMDDVISLFEQRSDFPLRLSDFTKICASWNEKSYAIAEITSYCNINPDTVLFIDDNIGELLAIENNYKNIKLFHAYDDANLTVNALEFYPRLLRLKGGNEDKIRSTDIKANADRLKMKNSLSHDDYLRSLKIELTFVINDKDHIARISELANKTNQFIFSYKRYSESQVEELMSANDSVVVSIELCDVLSDSGIVGVCVGKKVNGVVLIEECFVSCRALGRGIDDVILLGAISDVCSYLKSNLIQVLFVEGERNMPAKKIFDEYLHNFSDSPGEFEYTFPKNIIGIEHINRGVK